MVHPLNSICEQAWEAIKLPGQPDYGSLGIDYRATLYDWAEYAMSGQPIEEGEHPGARFKRAVTALLVVPETSRPLDPMPEPAPTEGPVIIDSDGELVVRHDGELVPFHLDLPVTVAGDKVHVPSFEVPSTVPSGHPINRSVLPPFAPVAASSPPIEIQALENEGGPVAHDDGDPVPLNSQQGSPQGLNNVLGDRTLVGSTTEDELRESPLESDVNRRFGPLDRRSATEAQAVEVERRVGLADRREAASPVEASEFQKVPDGVRGLTDNSSSHIKGMDTSRRAPHVLDKQSEIDHRSVKPPKPQKVKDVKP